MRVSTLLPDNAIRSFVRRIAVIEARNERHSADRLPCYADGCPGIVFSSGDGCVFTTEPRKRLSPLFVYGQTISPVSLEIFGDVSIVIFYLHPHVVHSIFGFDAAEIADTCLDLTLLPEASILPLLERLLATESAEERIAVIGGYLADAVRKVSGRIDSSVQAAIQHIILAGGSGRVQEIEQQLNSSQRTFERRFLRHVGVTPKLFSRIIQFQAALQTINSGEFEKLSDVAYAHGYSDQSHFIRSFRQFTGTSPQRFCSYRSVFF